jgi:hypothetical protein
MAGLAANQDASHRARGADAHGGFAALDLGARCIGEVRTMAFARMDDCHAKRSGVLQQGLARGHDARELRDIVTLFLPRGVVGAFAARRRAVRVASA